MSQNLTPIRSLQPIVGLEQLYAVASRLNKPPANLSLHERIATLLEPLANRSFSIIDAQVSGLLLHQEDFRPIVPPRNFDYGFVRAIASHCITVDEMSGDGTTQVNQDPNQELEVMGWVTGMDLGYDLTLDPVAHKYLSPIIPTYMNGIWLHLAVERPSRADSPFIGTMVQLPDAQLFNPLASTN